MRAIGVRLWAALCFVLIVVSAGGPARGDGLEALEIMTSTGRHAFEVEIAKDDATRERGLMDRRYMAANRGMLFEFDRDAPVVLLDEEHLHPARHDLHCAFGRRDAHRRQRRAAVRARHSLRRPVRRGARAQRRNRARRSGSRSATRSAIPSSNRNPRQARCIRRQDCYTRFTNAAADIVFARGVAGDGIEFKSRR